MDPLCIDLIEVEIELNFYANVNKKRLKRSEWWKFDNFLTNGEP